MPVTISSTFSLIWEMTVREIWISFYNNVSIESIQGVKKVELSSLSNSTLLDHFPSIFDNFAKRVGILARVHNDWQKLLKMLIKWSKKVN